MIAARKERDAAEAKRRKVEAPASRRCKAAEAKHLTAEAAAREEREAAEMDRVNAAQTLTLFSGQMLRNIPAGAPTTTPNSKVNAGS